MSRQHHHPIHIQKRMHEHTLYVITPISNHLRYQSRYELYRTFEKHVTRAGAQLITVELALGDRPFELTEECDPRDIQLRTLFELWHKENLINIAISRLPSNWEYVAWIDGDVEFVNDNWVQETIQALQHYQVVQMFQTAVDLGPQGQALQIHNGFMYSYLHHFPAKRSANGYYNYGHWHPGFAWAANREAINHLGGLIDFGILGSSDHHMAWALVGRVLEQTPKRITTGYREMLLEWQRRANTHIRKDVGYVEGTILHFWHGKKKDRRYRERWDILHKHNFDPRTDLKRDWQGVYQLTSKGMRMQNDIREYFRMRSEDSIDLVC